MTPIATTAARWLAAAAILVGGLVHIYLYYQGYRSFPNANLGRSFVLNAVASAAVATLLVARSDRLIQLAGIAVAAGTLIAFTLTRVTDRGIFGFTEKGLDPSPEAIIALVAEIAAIVLLILTLVTDLLVKTDAPPRRTPLAISVAGLVVAAAATIGVGAAAAHKTTPSASSAIAATTPSSATTPGTTSGTAPSSGPATTAESGTSATATTTPSAATTAGAGSSSGGTSTATTAAVSPSSGTAASTAGAATAGDQAVTIKSFAFAPQALKITVGTKVTWTNQDSFAHNVTSADKSFVSDPKMGGGATYSYTFATPGSYTYICTIHAYMTGTVTVT